MATQAVPRLPSAALGCRNSTTLIVTSDHGRGSTLADWSGHGSKVPGADKIWIAILGPDTPASGEITTHAEQRDIAQP